MRDGVVAVAEPGTCPSVSLLRALKREFGFYCIELVVEQAVEPEQPEVVYVVGGTRTGKHGAVRRVIGAVECGGSHGYYAQCNRRLCSGRGAVRGW
jgi:hypothetical protein